MEKALSIIALSCTLSAVYQSRILPYQGSFLKFMTTIAFGFLTAVILYKVITFVITKMITIARATTRKINAQTSEVICATNAFVKELSLIPQKMSNKISVIKFLLKKNSRIQLKLETVNADLHEALTEINVMVDNWSPNFEVTKQKSINKAVIKPATQDLHDYEFIEKTVLETSRQLTIENNQPTLL